MQKESLYLLLLLNDYKCLFSINKEKIVVVAENIKEFIEKIPENVKLIAVSKTKPIELIQEAYDGGYRVFGENKAQELQLKYETLPKDIQWHMIGHMQTNKVKYIAQFVNLIHGVDSLKLLSVINKEAKKNNRVIDCLLQIHIAQEEAKFGFDIEEIKAMLISEEFKLLKNVKIVGLMGMATYTNNDNQIANEFKSLKDCFDFIKEKHLTYNDFKEISMGMSGDYKIAIAQGSTMIRIGSSIFGQRNYNK